jgi:hypothetical protein
MNYIIKRESERTRERESERARERERARARERERESNLPQINSLGHSCSRRMATEALVTVGTARAAKC